MKLHQTSASMDASEISGEREEDSGIDSGATDPSDTTVYIRISVPEIKLQKCLQFNVDDTIWQAKQVVLSTVAKELKDGMNYGMYLPPANGRAGKFLDEERTLRDYPLPGPIGFLEFKYKRRVYKLMQINPKKLKQLHTKANLRQFLDLVRRNDCDKVTKMCNRGLDPNFHEHETGDCPLTLACVHLSKARSMILTLISGGAHLDFRSRDSLTPMHKAAKAGNYEAIKTLLDLGASPNYKDLRGLTPLYWSVVGKASERCVQMLLHDHAVIGCTDEHGATEIHHACKDGKVQVLEHLLYYGGDLNSQNASGNTPLHVCAVNNQESCARVMLFRGADRNIQNYASQDPFQVAVISGNTELADVIKNFDENEVVLFQELPAYNEKRRTPTISTLHTLKRTRSNPSLHMLFSSGDNSYGYSQTSSPVPSNHSSLRNFPMSNGGWRDADNMSISSTGSYSGSVNQMVPPHGNNHFSTLPHNFHNDNNRRISRSYSSDMLDMLSVGEQGFWEGKVDGKQGWFPSNHVQEVHLPKNKGAKSSGDSDSVIVKKDTLAALVRESGDHSPRTVVLQKGKNGFGFVLRGAKSQNHTKSTLEFVPTPDLPALQYLDRVDKGSPADKVGLKPGDFLLEINNEVVVNATHEHTVRLIKQSGDTLAMKVVTVKPLPSEGSGVELHLDGTRTLPTKKKVGVAPLPPQRHPHTSLSELQGKRTAIQIQGLMELEKLDATLAQYESQTDQQMDSEAHSRNINVKNKTASIGRHSQRMSTIPIDEIFSQSVDDTNSSRDKPVVVMPKTYHSPQNQATNSTKTVDERSVANVRLSRVPDNDRVTYGNEERVYAVPFKSAQQPQHYADGGLSVHIGDKKSIPPPPKHAPPQPPASEHSGSGDSGEIVRISTRHSSGYSNVSEEIQSRKSQSPVAESSFRPGVGAKMSNQPAVAAVVHSRDSSVSSTVSSMSSHSEQKTQNTTYYEPSPDYDDETPKSTVQDAPREKSTDHFSNAIKAAAAARENKLKSVAPDPPKSAANHTSHAAPSGPPPPPPPPSGPPAPPPPPGPPPKQSQGLPKKTSMPAPVQRQLQENVQQEKRHAALMAAIAKRRNVVESNDMESVAQHIESRVHKSQQSKSLVFDSKNSKPEFKAPNQTPVAPLVRQHKAEVRPSVTPKSGEQMPNKESSSVVSKSSEDRLSSVAKSDKETAGVSKSSAESNGAVRSSSSFTAQAEKARLQYLANKNTSPVASPPPSMSNIAPVIAQRANERRKTYEQVDSRVRASGGGHTLLDTRVRAAPVNSNNNNNRAASHVPTSPQRNRVLTNGSVQRDPLDGIDIVPPPPVFDGSQQFDMPAIAPPPPGFADSPSPQSDRQNNYTSHM